MRKRRMKRPAGAPPDPGHNLLAASSLAAGKPVLGTSKFGQEHRLEAASLYPPSARLTPPAKQPTHHRLKAIGIGEIPKKRGRRRLDEATAELLQAKLRTWITTRNRSRLPTQKQSREYVEKLPDAKPFKGTTIERRVVRPVHQELKSRQK
jgi:hypothetical protein